MRFSAVAILASISSVSASFYCKRPGFGHGSQGYGGNCLPNELVACKSNTVAGVWPECANRKPNVQCWVDIYRDLDGNQQRGYDCYYWDGAW